MKRSPAAERATGAATLLALVALLVLPPVALGVFVGWPLPTSLPRLEQLTEAARQGIDDAVVVKLLAVVAWLAWLQVAAAVFAEVTGIVRGRVTRRLPVPTGLQTGVARLIAAAMLLLATSTTRPSSAASAAPAAVSPAPIGRVPIQLGPSVSAPPDAPSSRATAQPPLYEVRRHDSLWSIAEQTLGEGLRWREIADLNAGLVMADGDLLTDGGHIEPGWLLRLPGGAAHGAGGVGTNGTTDTAGRSLQQREVAVQRGDHLWSIAEDALGEQLGRPPAADEVTPYWQQLVEANTDRLAEPDNPSLLFAGQTLVLPDVPPDSPQPSDEATASTGSPPSPAGSIASPAPPSSEPASPPQSHVAETTAPAPVAPPVSDPAPMTDTQEPADESPADDILIIGLLGVAGSGIAVGLARALNRRRRRRRLRPAVGVPPFPDPALDDLRGEIVLAADEDGADGLDRRLRHLAAAIASTGRSVRPRIVQAANDRFEVLLSGPVDHLPGWRNEADGTVWTCHEDLDSVQAGDPPTPLLISLGRREDSGQLYLDLEAEHLLLVTGDEQSTNGFVSSIVLELAHSALADGANIIVVGDLGTAALATLDRVRVVDRWADVADSVLAWAEQSSELLAANEWPNTFHGRAAGSMSDGLRPLLVVCAQLPADDLFITAAELVRRGDSAVTLLAIGDELEGATRIELTDDLLRIPVLDLTCRAQSIDDDTIERATQLLAEAERLADPAPNDASANEDSDELLPLFEEAADQDDADCDPAHHIRIRLLGDIDVSGTARPLTPKQTAVIAYIALHAPALAERIEDAVWTTPTASRHKRLVDTLSECRAALGVEQLPIASNGRYQLGPGVRTDLELFDRRVRLAADQPPEAAITLLKGAVELIQGLPFTYRNADRDSYVWVDLENWCTNWELKITSAAAGLADLCLHEGQVDDAIWAAQQGLVASPMDTRLTEALMRAYAERGDRVSVERVYKNHVASLEKLQIDDVAESTVELRKRLGGSPDGSTTF